jgi:CubicO group peptidase (beta-lactamase class C family)
MQARRYLILGWVLFLGASVAAFAGDLPQAAPEQAGFSSAKLELVKPIIQAMLDKKETAGTVTIVARHGKVVYLEALGMMDAGAGKPMRADTIFRIYSMSKPITTVAAMMLCEEGRFQLDDPVSKYLPEFKTLRVHAGKGNETVEAKGEITIRDLMRHTSGLTYGFFGKTPVDRMYVQNGILANPKDSLADLVTKLGKLPLLYQPGTHFNYSVSTDVLGRLIEVVSGKSFDEFFQERIFGPLDMKDTGFFVPEDKLERFAACYGPDEKGGLKVTDVPAKSRYRNRPKLLSGGGGLVSTARDYVRFCQMVLQGGELQGTRLLRKETIQQMTSNQLPEQAMPLTMAEVPRPGLGFGLGFSVRLAANKGEPSFMVGEYGWGGAASTHFWICPQRDLVVVALQQYMPFTQRLETAIKPVIYDAIVE